MEKLNIDFKNCYGIKDLEYNFDFSSKSTYAIYAPNGTMKTSFASTMQDFSNSIESKDSVFTNRACTRTILDENNSQIDPKKIFVVVPYDQAFKSTRISTLLVKKELKDRYDELYELLNEKKSLLIDHLQRYSGLRRESIESTVSKQFTASEDDFFIAIGRVKSEVVSQSDSTFSDINYAKVFT